jgi:hypothetical protein
VNPAHDHPRLHSTEPIWEPSDRPDPTPLHRSGLRGFALWIDPEDEIQRGSEADEGGLSHPIHDPVDLALPGVDGLPANPPPTGRSCPT